MSPMWILWGWLAGIPAGWAIAARRFGIYLDTLKERARLRYDDPERISDLPFTLFGYWILVFLAGPAWFMVLFIVAFFSKGQDVAKARKDLNRRMKEAEAEIERIRQQEGWAKS